MEYSFKFIISIVLLLFCFQLYAQTPVVWEDQVNTTASGNTITKNSGVAKGWNAGAASENTLLANTDGWVEITALQDNINFMFGLSDSNTNESFNTIDYAIYIRKGATTRIYENGAKKSAAGTLPYVVGDVFRVEREGTSIKYKRNGTTFYTSGVSSAGELIVDVSILTVDASISNVNVDFGSVCSTTVYADTDGDGFGDPSSTTTDCSNPLTAGWVADNTDCDDTDASINPNTVWYEDSDSDNFGNPAVSQTQCTQPAGYVLDGTDCDDTANSPSNDCGVGGASVWTQSGNDIRYSDGKVWIGDIALDIASDDYNLFVEKGIMTERLKVAIEGSGDWADYVFADDYKRVQLEELEIFIKKNKHLPNVPSAQEVAKNGIDVAKMDATLLQQIEELWLHVIDLKKENQVLKQTLSGLDK